jgi:hypothetical protein
MYSDEFKYHKEETGFGPALFSPLYNITSSCIRRTQSIKIEMIVFDNAQKTGLAHSLAADAFLFVSCF